MFYINIQKNKKVVYLWHLEDVVNFMNSPNYKIGEINFEFEKNYKKAKVADSKFIDEFYDKKEKTAIEEPITKPEERPLMELPVNIYIGNIGDEEYYIPTFAIFKNHDGLKEYLGETAGKVSVNSSVLKDKIVAYRNNHWMFVDIKK